MHILNELPVELQTYRWYIIKIVVYTGDGRRVSSGKTRPCHGEVVRSLRVRDNAAAGAHVRDTCEGLKARWVNEHR